MDYFRNRGHDKITVFVPEWRKEASKPETPITDQEVLYSLEREGVLKYTPSRRIRGKRVACYDDRFILDLATHEEGVIVSNDQFRDLMDDKPEWREVIETRLLPFQFVNDYFMIPEDPMGKDGPTLDQLLAKDPRDVPGRVQKPSYNQSNMRQVCPYLEKCTFGRKCKFYHPEREARNEAAAPPQSSSSPVNSRTPNTSRSATPSPSPDKWHTRYSNRSSGEDLRQLHSSNNGSTDDLCHYQTGTTTTMDLSEIAEKMESSLSLRDGPNQAGYYDPRTRQAPPHTMNLPPNSIRSAPVFSSTADSAASTPSESHHPQRYTFPMAVLPQSHHIKSRTHIVTEQHHLSALTPQSGGPAGHLGYPLPGPEMDPNVRFPPHQHHGVATFPSPSGYPPSLLQQQEAPLPSAPGNHVSHQTTGSQSILPGMFMPRDGRLPPTTPYPAAPPPPPHELHGHGSLMQLPPGFYPSQGQPSGPPGYYSRAADPNHLHPVGPPVTVPSTHTSPYHHHQHQDSSHLQHRHHSVDYGNPQNVSPLRRRSYSNEVQKHNGHIPQATTSGFCGPQYYEHQHSHQSTAFATFSQPHSSQLPPSHSSHYHQSQVRLPAVNERSYENGGSIIENSPLFLKAAAVYPGCDDMIRSVMLAHPHVMELEELQRLLQSRQ